jgi:hypothetical protein
MSKIKDFLKNDHIQVALGTGACIIILALFFKKVMQYQDVPALESALPGLALTAFEYARLKNRSADRFWTRPWFWNLAMLAIVGLVILRRLYFM